MGVYRVLLTLLQKLQGLSTDLFMEGRNGDGRGREMETGEGGRERRKKKAG